jgi:hypothetical protein
MYRLYVTAMGARPLYYSVAAFLWGGGVEVDSDGDCESPSDRNWTELTLSKRNHFGNVCVDPVSREPLVLVVASRSREDAARAAYYLAAKTKGTCSWSENGPSFSPDQLCDDIGSFDLKKAFEDAERYDHG